LQELLGLERIGIHDDLFRLGFDSLLATRYLGRIKEALNVDLPLTGLFERPTVAGQAKLIDTLSGLSAGQNEATDPVEDLEHEVEEL
jgi:aryl carrier-like protein